MMMITKGVIILHHKSFILAKIFLNSSQYISGEKRRVFGPIGSPNLHLWALRVEEPERRATAH